MNDYTEWAHEVMKETKKGVLMTMGHINNRRHKSEMDYFTSQQLDDLKDCVEIMERMHRMHHGHAMHHMADPAIPKPM